MARSVSSCRRCVLFLVALFLLCICAPAGQTLLILCRWRAASGSSGAGFSARQALALGPSRSPGTAGAVGSIPAPFPLCSCSVPAKHTSVWEPPCQKRPCLGFQTCAVSPRPGARRHLTNLREPKSQQKMFSHSVCLKLLSVPPPAEQKPAPSQGRVQCLQHLPEPRAGVRLPEEFGDRGEDQ